MQAFVFLLSIRKKKLAKTIIRVFSRIVHTLDDTILRIMRNQQSLCTTFVKKLSSLILTYCRSKLGLFRRS